MITIMRAIMLAAGTGSRLSGGNAEAPPKSLLEFGGKTLLQLQLECLRDLGVAGLSLVIGYRADAILGELERLGAADFVETILNTDFELGSMLSLGRAHGALVAGEDILFMDADVLYAPSLISRLTRSAQGNCFLFDRDFEAGDEPVKICLRQGAIVDFGKRVGQDHDDVGEWPGFLRLSAPKSKILAGIIARYLERGDRENPYEDALYDLIVGGQPGDFGIEDISGEPWIEIDFPEDAERARTEILPRIDKLERD